MLGSVLPMANPVAASAGKIIPTDKAKVDLLKKFHIPKATELSKSEFDMCLAYMAGRIAMSAPKLAPENIHMIKKATMSPDPIKQVNRKVMIASNIPIERINFNSYLEVKFPQKGIEIAALIKNVMRNNPAKSVACKRDST